MADVSVVFPGAGSPPRKRLRRLVEVDPSAEPPPQRPAPPAAAAEHARTPSRCPADVRIASPADGAAVARAAVAPSFFGGAGHPCAPLAAAGADVRRPEGRLDSLRAGPWLEAPRRYPAAVAAGLRALPSAFGVGAGGCGGLSQGPSLRSSSSSGSFARRGGVVIDVDGIYPSGVAPRRQPPRSGKRARSPSQSSSFIDDDAAQQEDGGRTESEEDIFEGQGSDSESASSDAGPATRAPTRSRTGSLRIISSQAMQAVLASLAGPAAGAQAVLQGRRVDLRKTISGGCTKLRTDHWGPSEEVPTLSGSFRHLKEHQRVGVRWLLAMHRSVPGMILADEMGLGKTLQTLCFLDALAAASPTKSLPSLIVVPASLLDTWVNEAAKWTPALTVMKYHSSGGNERDELRNDFFDDPGRYRLIVTTAASVHNKDDQRYFYRKVNFEYVICDEAHAFKNASSARHRDLAKLVKCRRRLLLTGTPIQNSLTELVTLLGFALHEHREVYTDLQAIQEQPLSQAMEQVQNVAAPLILRRLKLDVLTELPKKQGIVTKLDMVESQRRAYDKILRAPTKKAKRDIQSKFFELRRVCLHPLMGKSRLSAAQMEKFTQEMIRARPDFRNAPRAKVDREVSTWSDFDKHRAAVEYKLSPEFRVTTDELLASTKIVELARILRENSANGDKTLVFSQFTQYLDVIEDALYAMKIPSMRLDGTTAIADRSVAVGAFQSEGGPLVFLISMKCGGTGLNLTAANTVVMMDLDFNPQNCRQAEDRVHRLGQTREVVVHYLVCRDSIEEMILKRVVPKMHLDRQFGGYKATLEDAEGIGAIEESEVAGTDEVKRAKKRECEVLKELTELCRSVGNH